ncbi:DMT family transporter [Lysinibacillus yapensis]|uniref:DMT family transporter n=1 Tax=Ureibacillus yapensis TaxID=2304605 RepID=A0A396S2X3_9BACL|nr:DMT family transporter [Lysinibacillus yapensis]RHW32055.1 DMT family transporter [Lysinibacillus yapensis]
MWILAAVLTMFCFGINNMIFKATSGTALSKVHMQFFFYLIAFFIILGYGLIEGFASFNTLTIVLGAFIGILNANGNIQMAKAFEKGPASITSPLISTNTVIPVLSAALIFQEHITLIQWIGILVMLASAAVIQYVPGNIIQMDYKPWMVHVLLSIGSFGVLGVLMKTSSHLHIDSVNTLFCMYAGGAAYLIITSMITKEKWQRIELGLGTIMGCINVIAYCSYFFALNTGVASIVFPIVSLSCVIVVLGSCWLYKERLKAYQVIGVVSALVGIVITKI